MQFVILLPEITFRARLFDAIVVAIALATGAGSVMYIFGHMTGGVMG